LKNDAKKVEAVNTVQHTMGTIKSRSELYRYVFLLLVFPCLGYIRKLRHVFLFLDTLQHKKREPVFLIAGIA